VKKPFFAFLFLFIAFNSSSFSRQRIPSWRLSLSSFGTYGDYASTTPSSNFLDKRTSQSFGVYGTFIKGVHSSYSFGTEILSLDEKPLNKNFFSQQLYTTRGSWWLGGKWSVAAHGAILHEDDFDYHDVGFVALDSLYSFPATMYYFIGGGILFHQSQFATASVTGTLSLYENKIYSQLFTAKYSYQIAQGLFNISAIDAGKTKSTPLLLSAREQLTYFYSQFSFNAKVSLGKRVFFFDESLLVLFNQREQQTVSFGGGVSYFFSPKFSLIGTFEFEKFDSYTISYTALGLKYNYVSE